MFLIGIGLALLLHAKRDQERWMLYLTRRVLIICEFLSFCRLPTVISTKA